MVAGTVEHDRRHVVDAAPESLGDPADVLGDRAAQVDRGAGPRADRQLTHVHVGQGLQRAGLADRDHRHRPSPAPRDHTTSFQGVERQIDLLAAGSHALSPREGLVLVRTGADHDVTVDRQVLERGPHRLRGVALGALLVGPPQPARPRQRRSLRRPRVALTEAVPVECRAFALPDRCGLRHPTFSNCSALSSTSSIACAIASSMLLFSITGTPAFSARPTM